MPGQQLQLQAAVVGPQLHGAVGEALCLRIMGHEEVAIVQRPRALVGAAGRAVGADRHLADVHLRRHVGDGLLRVAAFSRVDDADRAAAPAVVSRHRAEHAARAPGDGAGFDESRRAKHAIAEVAGEHRAVGMDGPQFLDGDRRPIDVLPAAVDDAAVFHHRGSEVVQVVGADPPHVAAVGVHAMEHTHGRVPAVGELRIAGREEGDAAVRQPAGVEVVMVAGGELPRLAALDRNGEEMKRLRHRFLPGEEHGLAVERQLAVKDHACAGIDQLRQRAGLPPWGSR